jgi:site-specific recombinase XerD
LKNGHDVRLIFCRPSYKASKAFSDSSFRLGSRAGCRSRSKATDAYIEFFTATIRNRNTRLAYARACYQFFHWCQENGLTLDSVRPFQVAAYIEQMPGSKPTIKQKLAAIWMLYDFLVIRQLVPVNPTASVRGPKYVVKRGKTPVWSREDAKKLLESIPRDDLAGLRDRALISTMLFSLPG